MTSAFINLHICTLPVKRHGQVEVEVEDNQPSVNVTPFVHECVYGPIAIFLRVRSIAELHLRQFSQSATNFFSFVFSLY